MTVIVAGAPRIGVRGLPTLLREVYAYRELVRNFVLRDLKARYKNSVLGFAWSLLNPLLMMIVFSVVFTVLFKNEIASYPVFVLLGLLAWNWCTSSVVGATTAIVGNAHLVRKVNFPRQLLPLSVVLSNGVNFLLALIPLFAVLLVFGVQLTPYALLLPLVVAIQVVFLLGMALLLSAINVFFRDTEVIVDVAVLAWFFLTPVFYRVEDLTAAGARLMYIANPMASLISTYRLILFWGAPPAPDFLARMAVQALVVFAIGALVFLHLAPAFGEEV